jgi:hypothetical protein
MAEDLRKKLTNLIAKLTADGKLDEDEAFDIASDALNEDPELVAFMEMDMCIGDPVGYVANRLSH